MVNRYPGLGCPNVGERSAYRFGSDVLECCVCAQYSNPRGQSRLSKVRLGVRGIGHSKLLSGNNVTDMRGREVGD
jgi:hypothetical protein